MVDMRVFWSNHFCVLALISLLVSHSATPAIADVADGPSITCIGDGPKTIVSITGPHSAMMLIEGIEGAFPVEMQVTDGNKVFRVGENMFLIVNPSDGRGFVSKLDGKSHNLAYLCRS